MSKNGGPAFPNMAPNSSGPHIAARDGMTLRQYYAAQAMHAMIIKTPLLERVTYSDGSVVGADEDLFISHRQAVADAAFLYADAMLAAEQ
jgi:hypothetical protein